MKQQPVTTRGDSPPPEPRASQRRSWPSAVNVRPVMCTHCGHVITVPADPRAR